MKRLTVLLLVLTCIISTVNVSADADSVITAGYIQSEKAGNIFSAADTSIKFTQSYKNIVSEAVVLQTAYQVWNEDGVRIKEYPLRSIEIPSGGEKIVDFVVENPGRYGLYTLKIINSITTKRESYTQIYEEGFSVCIELDEKNANPDFGFAQQIIKNGYGNVDVTPSLMRNAGASWYREECFVWSAVEKSKGVYTLPDGAKEKLRKIKDSGLEIVCILNGTNGSLYKFPSTTEGIDAFVAYCGFVARELDGIVDHYEIWNEWNKKKETDTGDYYKRTDLYAEVLKKAYKAVKAVNENNTVIGCVTAGIDYEWIDGVLTSLGTEKAMDAVSVHCYQWTAENGVDEAQLINYTAELRNVLKEHSQDIPIWITEVGFSTFEGASTWIAPCTREQQLNSLVLVNAMNKAYGLYDKLIQYCFHDRANIAGVESNWGLVNCWQRGFTDNAEAELTPFSAKPSYLGIAAMNYFTGGNTELLEVIKEEQDRAYMLKFKNNNLKENVMLCINGDINTTTEKTVELGTDKVKIYDKYGNLTETKTSENGSYTFEVSAEPMYAVWSESDRSFLNVEVEENTKTVTISGKAEAPEDLVSVLIVSKGKALDGYEPERTLFVGQATADENSEYSISFVMTELSGQFDVYANSKLREEKLKEDMVFAYSVPEIKVMQSEADVHRMSELNVSAPVDVELRGFNDLSDENAVLIIAQYSQNVLKFAEFDKEAVGDCTQPGSEIKKSFEVKDGTDKIKVMYINANNTKPFVAAYEIK